MKAKIKETENLVGKRIWIVTIDGGSCDYPSKYEAWVAKRAIDEACKMLHK